MLIEVKLIQKKGQLIWSWRPPHYRLQAENCWLLATAGVVAKENGIEQRTVLIEFDSFETAVAAYESEAYQKALDVLAGGADRDVRLFEGL